MARSKMTEKELAAHVVAWLRVQHYEVYQEVQISSYGSVADIVVDVNGLGWVIETKTNFGLGVIGQAHQWQKYHATRVSVAVPSPTRPSAAAIMGWKVCHQFGIGQLYVCRDGSVDEKQAPRFVRPPPRRLGIDDILTVCCETHKTHCPAGSAGGGHWTAYQQTISAVKSFLSNRDWTPLRAIVEHTRHHYCSNTTARACLGKLLQTVEAEKGWIEFRTNGRRLEFRATAGKEER